LSGLELNLEGIHEAYMEGFPRKKIKKTKIAETKPIRGGSIIFCK